MVKNIDLHYFIFAFMLAGGVYSFYIFVKKLKHYLLIKDIPTSKIRSAAMGIVELKGKTVPKHLIFSPFSRKSCVYYRYRVEEYRKRHSKDGIRYSWEQIASGEKRISFYLEDETGKALIMPDEAEIMAPVKAKRYQSHAMAIGMDRKFFKHFEENFASKDVDLKSLGITDRHSGMNMVGDRRFFEHYIEPEEKLYILGSAFSSKKDGISIVVSSGKNEKTFIISNKSEKSLLKFTKFRIIFSLIASILLVGFSVAGFLRLKNII